MQLIPLYDETAPVACTIGADEVSGRIALLESMRGAHTALERTDFGLLLTFPNTPEVEADLQRFVVDEKRCCEFWGFALKATSSNLTLQWDGPPAANDIIERLASFFGGDEPLEALAGLL